jgi:hypothetical protein
MALNAEAQNFLAELVSQLSPSIQQMVTSGCQTFLARSGAAIPGTSPAALPPANGGYPVPVPPGCPTSPMTPPWPLPNCPVVCDPCAFPALASDLMLFSFPQIDAEAYDVSTNIDVIVAGGPFPLAAGTSVTLQQEARRSLTWIPDCVQIATVWSGGPPQPGLVTYQWAVGNKGGVGPGQVLFGNPQKGTQYECGDDCIKVNFPTWRGCNNLMIGALSALQLIVTLSPAATSVLEAVNVVVDHRRSVKRSCCGGCAGGGSCSCG